jgi:acetyl-CoA carboxylase biotin carboxyl carrier protein
VPPATSEAWLEAVRQVVAAVQSSDVSELELASTDFSVRLRRDLSTRTHAESADAEAEGDSAEAQLHRILAPFTGVFYRSPTPSARAYVNAGDWVELDAVIGLVETMKIFNEVTADAAGRIVRFTADNGQLVQAGDPLVLIEPGERAPAAAELHL